MLDVMYEEEKTLIAPHEIKELEKQAIKMPTKDGEYAPRLLRAFIEYLAKVHGVDIGFETKEMKDEREAKASKHRNSKGIRFNGKTSRNPPDDSF